MDLKLAGKTALITGGSKGIGRAAAEILAGEGCNLIIVSRSADALATAKAAIVQKANVRVDTVAADLSDSANVDQLARDYPDIDILVNNAGAIPGGTLLNVDEATWRKAWDLKVFGYVNMCRAFYAAMQKRKRGVIVNVVGNAADTHERVEQCDRYRGHRNDDDILPGYEDPGKTDDLAAVFCLEGVGDRPEPGQHQILHHEWWHKAVPSLWQKRFRRCRSLTMPDRP